MEQIPLSLDPKTAGAQQPEKKPVMGWFAVAFGFLGIFTFGVIFVPLGFICSLIALFTGQAVWGFVGLLLNVMGLVTSPQLLLLLGAGAFAMWFDWNDFIEPVKQMIGMGGTEV